LGSFAAVHLSAAFDGLRSVEPAFLGAALSAAAWGRTRARGLGLPGEHQEELLSGAQKYGWTIAEVTRRATDVRRRSQLRSGRPPASPEKLLEREVRRHIAALERLLAESRIIESCSTQRLVGMLNALHELKNQLAGGLTL
jgi:hypothetical protein